MKVGGFIILLALCAPVVQSLGQTSSELDHLDSQIRAKQGELDRLRRDIRRSEERIAANKKAEVDALNQLFELEERISLTSRLVKALESEIVQLSQAVQGAGRQIQAGEAEIAHLKTQLAARFVHIYKQRQASLLELILTSQKWNQAAYRAKYLRVAADYDRYLTGKVKEEIRLLQSRRQKLDRDRARKTQLLAEKEHEEKQLISAKRKRRTQVEKTKRDRRNDERMLVEKRQAAVAVQRLLAGLEVNRERRAASLAEMRKKRDLAMAPDITFYKGKLPWPTLGPVVARFGPQRNPRLKTVTENPGIDIQAPAGTPVKATLSGLVTVITYMRGYGTTIIIDHGKDLYTIYAHLEEIQVSESDYVDQGQMIAHVGSSGSLDGPKLHFEVYVKQQKQDPELWLAKPIAGR